MFATKETSVIIFAAVGAAVLLMRGLNNERAGAFPAERKPRPLRDLALGLGLAAFTAAVLFSSFFSYPRGILDSVLAFGNYFAKSGDPGFHAHPVGYYFSLLTYSRNGGLVWSESLILALACLGIMAAVRKRGGFPAAAALASVFAAAAFSLLAYKTPWNVLPFHLGFVVLAGVGTEYLFRTLRKVPLKIVAGVLLGVGLLHLAWQSGQADFRYSADPRNPYVYAQTSPDYLKLVKRVDDIAAILPDRDKSLIKVVCGLYETWPLPWSLRHFAHVGYWQDAAATGGFEDAALVIASEEQAARIRPLIADRFHEEFYGLRPDVLLALFIRNESWERFLDGRRR
jgi:predicted membrane-bound mannosyltransferase